MATAPPGRDDSPGPPSEELHLPGPSYQPVLVAFGVTLAVLGVVISWAMLAIGTAITLVAVIRWMRDARSEMAELPLEHRG